MKNNFFIRRASVMMLFCLAISATFAQTPFFSENFNRGIPATWTSTGTAAKFVSCDSACLADYDQFSAGFAEFVVQSASSLPGSTFLRGTAALKAVQQTNLDAMLTSPAINCSGKQEVFVRFATVIWGGVNEDSLQTSANAARTCVLRVSTDGTTWKTYPVFNFNRRQPKFAFADISEVAANKSRVYIQFMRTDPENNQIWVVDDVTLSDQAPIRNVKVSVDMTGMQVSPKGVHIALEGKANAVKMTAMGNGVYTGVIPVAQSKKVRYKFVNGDSWGENESVPTGCGEKNVEGANDRTVTGGDDDGEASLVCFNTCIPCGNTAPKSTYDYCPKDPNVLYCENFEGMALGKLVQQSAQWTTNGLSLGVPLEALNDNPDIVSYWNGYTNYDGSKALGIIYSEPAERSDYPLLPLNPSPGIYRLDYRIYIPQGYGGNMVLYDETVLTGFSLYFSDSLVVSTLFDFDAGTAIPTGNPIAYDKNTWHNISVMFNTATHKITAKIDNKVVYDAVNENQEGFAFVGFEGTDYISATYPPTSVILIDDLVYRILPSAADKSFPADERGTPLESTVSPNPANEKVVVMPASDITHQEDWQVRLFNNTGQLVETFKGTGHTALEMPTQHLETGLYMIDFRSENMRWAKKVVVQH